MQKSMLKLGNEKNFANGKFQPSWSTGRMSSTTASSFLIWTFNVPTSKLNTGNGAKSGFYVQDFTQNAQRHPEKL